MTRADPFDRLTLALVAACIVLSLLVGIELLHPPEVQGALSRVAARDTEAVPNYGQLAYMPPQLDELTDMLERPLFFADRKLPVAPAPVGAAAPKPGPLRLWLEGVAIVADSRIAVLRNLDNNQLLQLTEGMSYAEWILESVTATGVRFRRDLEVAELTLDTDVRNRRRR